MNATKNNIGKNQSSRRKRTTTTALAIGRLRKVASKTQNSERNTERPTEIRTDSNAYNGFLKCRFLPKQEETPTVQDCKERLKIERDFYQSLSNFARQYNIEPMYTKDFGFPYNIALAMWDLEKKVEQVNEDWNSFKLIRNNRKILFVKEERYYTGTSLYYVPIVPLFQMLKDPRHKQNAQLLLSVCSYLYHIADVPYYRQQNSYLYWIYEMHEDWIEQGDEAEEDMQEFRREFKISKTIGEKIEKKLFNRKNLELFEKRLNHFKSRTDFDHYCYKVASDAFTLYTEYPETSIFRNQPTPEQDPYNDDNKAIGMDMYISFVADTKGCLYDNIEESINAEFNEYGSIEEPTVYTPINGTELSKADFDFENRFFKLMEDLYKILTL
ncbi:hypothetical protein CMT58_13065 [Elizabethkingia anophelis]|uniref:hypothetical protein n=1 Tax=Elizabethkingia anophelis TaxID=1117645 RepID=UPI00248D4896|nr:hypothetical protein [Elizabethkingia anophelis]EJC8060733.1 hypothetical protein [Elizabethkingia anophelis]MDV4007213.1 hypothetical protein [Elizabethkingia anophelis]WBS70705.1 hypothetical protein PF435_16065 [Elizabethkingia anophelis]